MTRPEPLRDTVLATLGLLLNVAAVYWLLRLA